jgi:hypothetical protein
MDEVNFSIENIPTKNLGKEDNYMLHMVNKTSLEAFGNAAKHYADLVKALTGKQPSYQDFTAFLEREGYAVPDWKKDVLPKNQ